MTRSETQVRAGHPARTSSLLAPGLDFRVWDVYHLCVLVVAMAQVWAVGPPSLVARVVATLALLGLAAAYVVRGRDLATLHEEATGPGLAYVATAGVLFVVAVVASEPAAWALASLCVQALLVLRWLVAVPMIAVLSLVQPLANYLVRHTTEGLLGLIGLAVAATVGSGVIAAWIDQISVQSEERARLLGELEASRGEVARLSHETGVLTERARLRAEIHDTLAQGYTSILALVQAAAGTTDRERATSLLDLAATTCRENLAEARAIVADAAPPSLDSSALADALARLVSRLEAETGAVCRLAITAQGPEGPEDLGRPTEVALLRVTQEALSNIRKHAQAHRVDVELSLADDWVTLLVTDDGIGLSSSPADPFGAEAGTGGFGVGGMRSRVEELGGSIDLGDAVGGGTQLRVELPR
ncbi:ATP-binding protein [Lapillicoccus sp.]|uniref:sensor histidine kinase n=1 Tax=Lapillicoccus sp. TaxID=1909287 RepID=UPI0025EEE7DE|nr:ATP-binding protein [Lapillicoccus sp.]